MAREPTKALVQALVADAETELDTLLGAWGASLSPAESNAVMLEMILFYEQAFEAVIEAFSGRTLAPRQVRILSHACQGLGNIKHWKRVDTPFAPSAWYGWIASHWESIAEMVK